MNKPKALCIVKFVHTRAILFLASFWICAKTNLLLLTKWSGCCGVSRRSLPLSFRHTPRLFRWSRRSKVLKEKSCFFLWQDIFVLENPCSPESPNAQRILYFFSGPFYVPKEADDRQMEEMRLQVEEHMREMALQAERYWKEESLRKRLPTPLWLPK